MKKQLLGLALLALANSAMAQDANTLRIKGQLDVFTDSVWYTILLQRMLLILLL